VVENVRRAIGEKAEMGRKAMSVREAIVEVWKIWRFEWYCSLQEFEYAISVIEVGDGDERSCCHRVQV
jgi:hypothetical protein